MQVLLALHQPLVISGPKMQVLLALHQPLVISGPKMQVLLALLCEPDGNNFKLI